MELEFISKNNIDKIWKYLNSIDVDVAKIFYLHYILDMTFKEISYSLKMKESTVKTILYRSLKNLRKEFGNGGDNNEEQRTNSKIF